MSHKPPTTRLAMPDHRPVLIGMILMLLGGVMVMTQLIQWRDLGWALIVIGGLTAVWWVSQAWRVLQFRRAMEREAERKAALNVTRRQKEEEERAQREADKKAREEQAARLKEQRAEEGRRRKEAEEAAARERAEIEARTAAEIARLKGLTPDALRAEVLSRLEARGYRRLSAEGDGILLERQDGGKQAVLQIVSGRSGRSSDVRDLEAWRRDVGATEAYLVSLTGFAPDAVRAAEGKPITLVESHLLASWHATAAETAPPL